MQCVSPVLVLDGIAVFHTMTIRSFAVIGLCLLEM